VRVVALFLTGAHLPRLFDTSHTVVGYSRSCSSLPRSVFRPSSPASPPALPHSSAADLDGARQECLDRIEGLQASAACWRWIGMATAILAGLASSLSGFKTGRSPSPARHRWDYAALIAGAFAAAAHSFPSPTT
jgi:anti-sigma-K factor RskA